MNDNLGRNRAEQIQDDDDEIDLRQLWQVVYRAKWGIVGLVAVVALLALVVVSAMTPIYSATATLLIEAEEANVVSIQEVYGIDSSKREYYETQFKILDSRKLAERVFRELSIQNHPEYARRMGGENSTLRKYIPFLPPP